ncbi:MAG TPA: DPP IV N-terminal domain-containing protein, partial [Tenuifilaceae bacterium]|nr:DPP IV N-terminal domain-containing protein [Tenuifilaceae bacterium]
MKRVIFLIVLVIPIFLYSCKKEPVVTKYSIEQFYKNKQVYGGKFSEDETRLLYTSNESGIYNLYEVSIADGTQKQLTNSTQESYFAIDYVPGTNKILYSADKGGNEIDHIYLLNEDGTSTDLTPEEKAKTGFVGWNKEKTAFYFLSTKRDPRFFDLYIMDTKTWKAKLLYQNDKGLSVNEISWDEKYVVLVESITTNDNKLYLVNRLTKEQKEISIPEQPGSYVARGFSLNGKYLYYTTNSQKEFQYLVSYNLETGERNTVFETNWDVINFFLSRYEKYRVIAINEDGKNTLKLFDHKTGQKVESPAIADGDIISIEISDSEKYMRISAGTSKSPADIYFYNMETKELKRLTNSLNPEIDQNQLVAAEVVRYKSFDGLDIPAIFYKPLDATEKNKVPALIWVHGGPGGQSRVGYFALIQYLTNNGYAILAVNNRGSSGYGQT